MRCVVLLAAWLTLVGTSPPVTFRAVLLALRPPLARFGLRAALRGSVPPEPRVILPAGTGPALVLGRPYLVQAKPGPKPGILEAVSWPRPARRRACGQDCARPARVRGLQNATTELGGRLRLQCRVTGNPPPLVSWYRNGKPLRPNKRVTIKHRRKVSRLIVRPVKRNDKGWYECRGANPIRVASSKAWVTIRPKLAKSTIWPPVLACPRGKDYCLNGGSCSLYPSVGEYVCQCAEGYRGHRCEHKDIFIIGRREGRFSDGPRPSGKPQVAEDAGVVKATSDLDATTKMLQHYWGR